jgi:hypothetical protein
VYLPVSLKLKRATLAIQIFVFLLRSVSITTVLDVALFASVNDLLKAAA